MHQYYALVDEDRTSRRLKLVHPDLLDTPFVRMPPAQVWQIEDAAAEDYTDWLPVSREQPLVSDAMKRILELYNVHIRWKQIHLVSPDTNHQELYWIAHVPAVEGTSIHSEFHPHDQTLKRLVLDAAQIKEHHYFRLGGVRETYFIVSLEAAESLLRRGLTGFRLHKLEFM